MPRAWTRLKSNAESTFIEGRIYGYRYRLGSTLEGAMLFRCEKATLSAGYRAGFLRGMTGGVYGKSMTLYVTNQFYLYSGKLTDLKKIEESFKKHLTSTTKRATLKNQEAGNV